MGRHWLQIEHSAARYNLLMNLIGRKIRETVSIFRAHAGGGGIRFSSHGMPFPAWLPTGAGVYAARDRIAADNPYGSSAWRRFAVSANSMMALR
jgi:hypothetical protein